MAASTTVPQRQFVRGDDYTLELTFKRADGTLYDLSGSTFTPSLDDAVIDFELDVTSAASGVVRLKLTGANTAALAKQFTRWDLLEVGTFNTTIVSGVLNALPRANPAVVEPPE